VHTFHVGKDRAMSIKYDAETKVKAVRLVTEHAGDYDTEWAAITAISKRWGMTPETLRRWVRQAQVDAGQRLGVSRESAREIRELKRKCAELERTIEVLKAATSFFAAGVSPAIPLICEFSPAAARSSGS
jgi:transposase